MPTCLASRTRSSLRCLSSLISVLLNDDQPSKRIVMRASRQFLASRSCSRSSVDRFAGRLSITTSGLYGAPAPYGTLAGLLSSPNHLRICFAKLRVTCIEASLSAALGAMARAVKAEREG
jgi:hypothetical protein